MKAVNLTEASIKTLLLPLKFCDRFHGDHQLQREAFQQEIHNTALQGSKGQPVTH